ncbi:MAG: hypothetical protein HY744_02780 [Deltaproteobacteria bacterium]|nr:hypothetical protein [Deltaproteobacteria bacterium]
MRKAVWGGMIIGSLLGGWVPTWFGADAFSFTGLLGSTVGGLAGVAVGYWAARQLL